MPAWEGLTPWLKAQLLVMALHQWGLQTFTIHLHSELEADWIANGKDPFNEIRIRMRKEMCNLLGAKAEYFFVIEGLSKQDKNEVRLHSHGGGFIRNHGDGEKIINAAAMVSCELRN